MNSIGIECDCNGFNNIVRRYVHMRQIVHVEHEKKILKEKGGKIMVPKVCSGKRKFFKHLDLGFGIVFFVDWGHILM